MTDRPPIPDLVRSSKVIAIGRNVPAGEGCASARPSSLAACMSSSSHSTSPRTRRWAITVLARAADGLDALVGAGTVLSTVAAERAVGAGARFIVSPHTESALIAWCTSRGCPASPGALSPTKMYAAWSAGASAVKLFPAVAVGTGYLRQLAGPLPDVPFVPTGACRHRRPVTGSRPAAWRSASVAGSSGTASPPASPNE